MSDHLLMSAEMRFAVIATTLLAIVVGAARAENLVRNGDFSSRTEAGLPASWTVVGRQNVTLEDESAPDRGRQCLRVDVVEDGGASYGQIYQNIRAKPNTLYLLQGKTRSTTVNAN